MKLYQVIKRPFEAEAGAVVGLSAGQYKDRAHRVTLIDSAVVKKGTPEIPAVPPEKDDSGKNVPGSGRPRVKAVPDEVRYNVRLGENQTFKVNEVMGLEEKPDYAAADLEELKGSRVPDPKVKVEAANERMQKIVAAIDKLSPRKREHFTSAGEPSVTALAEAVGFDITAAERDEAWSRKQRAAERR